MKDCYTSFLHFLPTEKENMTYEEFRDKVDRAIKRYNYLEPSEEMEIFFEYLYSFDTETYKVVRNKFKISYPLLKRLAKTINNVICISKKDLLVYLNFTVEMYKRKSSIVRGEVDKILKVDRNSVEYRKFENDDFDDETLDIINNTIIAARRKFRKFFEYLEDENVFGNMYSSFYWEELDSISSDVLDEIRHRVGKTLSSIDAGRNIMITDVVADDILIKNRRGHLCWKIRYN